MIRDLSTGRDDLSLRPETDSDELLLRALYASSRAEELALVPWNAAQRDAFLRMQFDAQRRHYRQTYPDARFDVVELRGTPIGRLYLHIGPAGWHLLDIVLLPEYRGQGIGTALLRAILEGARADAKPVHLYVDTGGRARSLYDRLDFTPVADNGIHTQMVWRPTDTPAES